MLPPASPITLAIVNARVWTGDARRPWADAIAVRDDRIAALGSSAEVRKLAPREARTIDAAGGMVVPGTIDVRDVDSERRGVERAFRACVAIAANAEQGGPQPGSLARGGLADFVLLDRDLTRIAPEMVGDVRVLLAVVEGRVEFERSSAR